MENIMIGEDSWQPNLVLDDGGDATHVLVKKFPFRGILIN